jgi:hypothetical protein
VIDQVLISKRLYTIGESYSSQVDPVSVGLAISLFQDAIEQLVWCIVKHIDLNVKETEPFTSIVNKIESSSDEKFPDKAKILELNKARIGFKHYGNLPAVGESEKFRSYTYDCLVVASERYLNTDFESVSLASLVSDNTVRKYLEEAQEKLAKDDIAASIEAVAHARFFLLKKLDQFLPEVDHSLRDGDRIFNSISELRDSPINVFSYLTQYLQNVSRFNAAILTGGNISDYLYFERMLPRVTQFAAGNTRVRWQASTLDKEFADKAINYVVETAIRLEGVIH